MKNTAKGARGAGRHAPREWPRPCRRPRGCGGRGVPPPAYRRPAATKKGTPPQGLGAGTLAANLGPPHRGETPAGATRNTARQPKESAAGTDAPSGARAAAAAGLMAHAAPTAGRRPERPAARTRPPKGRTQQGGEGQQGDDAPRAGSGEGRKAHAASRAGKGPTERWGPRQRRRRDMSARQRKTAGRAGPPPRAKRKPRPAEERGRARGPRPRRADFG